MIAWVYLNRVSYGTQSTLYSAVKGAQSAFSTYAKKKDGLFPMLPGENPESYVQRFFSEYANIHSSAWAKIYRIVQRAYKDWTTYGAGSGVDPTHGATDFRAKRPKVEINGRDEFNSWCANNAQACEGMSSSEISAKMNELVLALSYENALNFYPVSGYQWFKVGPISLRGVTFWLFFDDRSARTIGAK